MADRFGHETSGKQSGLLCFVLQAARGRDTFNMF